MAEINPDRDHTTDALRGLCTVLQFRIACGRKDCTRAKRCTGDAQACFKRFWPVVPEEMKVAIRAGSLAASAKLPRDRIKAEIERAQQRYRDSQSAVPPQAPAPPDPAQRPAKTFRRAQAPALARIRGL